jgi:uncharacterized membrane protein YeiH
VLVIFEGIGIVAFAFAGSSAAVQRNLDVFGVIVCAVVTALGGGVLRDLVLGVHPPTGLRTWWYYVACTATAVLVFFLRDRLSRFTLLLCGADAVGLGMFAVAGASLSVRHGMPWYAAAMIGMVNGIGGGMMVETMLGRTPTVLRKDIYALPALGGGVLVALGTEAGWPGTPLALGAVSLVVCVRMLAIGLNWHLPVARRQRVDVPAPDPLWNEWFSADRTPIRDNRSSLPR